MGTQQAKAIILNHPPTKFPTKFPSYCNICISNFINMCVTSLCFHGRQVGVPAPEKQIP